MTDTQGPALPHPLPAPPLAARRPHRVASPHGEREDPYYWMRDDARQAPEVLAHLQAENRYREAVMAPVKALEGRLFDEIVARIRQDDSSVPARRGAWDYYSRFAEGQEHPVYARRAHGQPQAPEQVLLDGPAMASGHKFFQIGNWEVSHDGHLLGWAEDTVGRRQWVLRFKDLRSGTLFAETIGNVEAGFAFANDGRTLYYVAKDPQTLLGHRVMRHVLGTPVAQDVEVFVNDDDSFYLDIGKSRSERFIVLSLRATTTTETRLLDAAAPERGFQVVLPRERDHEYEVEDLGDEFILRTNWQAPNFRVVRVPAEQVADRAQWREVVAHRDEAFIEDCLVFHGFLALEERSGGLSRVRVRHWDGSHDAYVPADEAAFTMSLGANDEPSATSLRYSYTSPATPASTYELDLASGERRLLKRQPVLGDFDPAHYVVEYRQAGARDGTHVPVTIVYRKGTALDGSAPLYQYAYGSYGLSSDPTFSIARLPLLERGFVYAIAHVRGGQELGRHWYDQGRLLAKQNTFNDFVDVTRFLVNAGYANRDKVFAMGGSAGGLLMGAVANQAPALYRGLVAHVPFVDVVTTMLDESIPLTTNEYDEWGNPAERQYYEYMLSYSPYDNVTAQAYPALFVTSGLWDSQVQYFEPAKWVARLRERKTDTKPLLMHVNMDAGHGGASGRFARLRENAMEYAWILQQLGMTK